MTADAPDHQPSSGPELASPPPPSLPGDVPRIDPLPGPFGHALTVDVEEWYHTCLVPEYVDPSRRPTGLAEELDFLLPELLEILAEAGRTATFFTLGEVARRLPERVRQIAAAGHEIASHSDVHFRVGERSLELFRQDVRASKALLEDLTGQEVLGFRAPEWSLRHPAEPRLPLLAEEGYGYDSSLAPFLGAGRLSNPRRPSRLSWHRKEGERHLLELPPLTFGGPLSLPAGSWPGRLAGVAPVLAAARSLARRGGLPVLVVHPWEISGRPTPGRLRGLAGFIHETGRRGYRERFLRLLEALPWQSLAASCAGSLHRMAGAGRSPEPAGELAHGAEWASVLASGRGH